jgi:nitrogen fixation NifU-like protein
MGEKDGVRGNLLRLMSEKLGSYNPVVLEHFNHPRNMGEMEDPDGVGEATNPACGDTMRLFIRVEKNRIAEAKFLTLGCVAAIASSSIITQMIEGKTVEEILMISREMVSEALGGLPPTKIHCSVLAEDAIRAAVADYRRKVPSPHPSPLGGEGAAVQSRTLAPDGKGEGHGKKGN